MLTRAEGAALFDRRREAWLSEDRDAYLACWSDDMTFRSPMHDPPLIGRAAYAELVAQSAAVMRPLAFDVHHLAAVGDAILAEWTIHMAARASGREASWDGMSRAEYRDGLIVAWREYWSPADVQAASAR